MAVWYEVQKTEAGVLHFMEWGKTEEKHFVMKPCVGERELIR